MLQRTRKLQPRAVVPLARSGARRRGRRHLSALAGLVSGLALNACGDPAGPPAVASVLLSPASATLASLGETVQLTASARDAAGREVPDVAFTWDAADAAVVTVSTSGVVTAARNGVGNVRATAGGVSGTAAITVAQAVARLAFEIGPGGAFVDGPVSPSLMVAVLDANGNRVVSAATAVEIAIDANPGGGSLIGTTASVPDPYDGLAIYEDLAVDRAGHDYTLVARYPGAADRVSEPFDVVAFAAVTTSSETHSCGLTAAGAAYCWGQNDSGQLGTGDSYDRAAPAAVAGGLTFSSLTAAAFSSCGLTGAGAAYCWGNNAFGSLGDGTRDARSAPVALSGGHAFTALDVRLHGCGIGAAGTVCWGYDGYGQLGTGSAASEVCAGSPCSTVPVAVTGGLSFTAVATGNAHTCALTATGAAYCWGHNGQGQLGDGSTTDRSSPTLVQGDLGFQQLTAGREHTCGLLADGTAHCWGSNDHGQLGDGTTTAKHTPTPASGGLAFRSLDAGSDHTCAVTPADQAYCWGAGTNGQLGTGTRTSTAVPVAVAGGHAFTEVDGGWWHSCGLTTTGAVYCWGAGSYGQLGWGRPYSSDSPVPVTGRP